MKRIKVIGMVVLIVLVIVSLSNAKPILYGGVGGGISRYWDSNSVLKYFDVNCGIGFHLFGKAEMTFDYEYNHFLPIVEEDGKREHHVSFHDVSICGGYAFKEWMSAQFGFGPSFLKGNVEFLEDDYIYRGPIDPILHPEGEIYNFPTYISLSCKVSALLRIPIFDNRLHLLSCIRARSGSFHPLFIGFYGPYPPYMPIQFSIGLVYKY